MDAPQSMDQDRSTTPTPPSQQASERYDLELKALSQLVTERRQVLGVQPATERRLIGVAIPNAMEQAQRELRERREEDERRQQRDRERRERWASLVRDRGSRYDECRLQNFRCDSDAQTSAVKALFDYCSNITERVAYGRGIVLFGPRGTGKDHLAMAVCRAAVRSDLTVRWQNGMDLFGDIRDAMDDDRGLSERQFIERLVRPDLLYLSDPLPPMGALTPFQASMLFRILDARYSRNKPVICTVNVSGGSELDERLGPQNADRLRHGSLAVFCCWPSARKAQ